MEAGFFSKNKKNVYALNDVSFSLPFGKTYGILGESGCGKTTCARVILQLYKHTSGKIFVNKKIFDDSDFNDNQNDKNKETFLEISSFSRPCKIFKSKNDGSSDFNRTIKIFW